MSIPAPAAPDLLTVLDVEGQIEPHILAALRDSGVFDPVAERSSQEATTPRVDLQIHLGGVLARNKPVPGAVDRRECLPSAWNVSVVFYIVTDRKVPEQQAAQGAYRAKVRLLGARFFTLLNGRLPYHQFVDLEESGTKMNLFTQSAATEDITQISFSGKVSVRPTAWPAGT